MVIAAVESNAIGSGSSEVETDPEVPERAPVRTDGVADKLRVPREYEELDKAGKGALLRREGLYSSRPCQWRKQRDRGAVTALAHTVARPGADPRDRELAPLRKEKAPRVIEIRGELSALLEGLAAERAAETSAPTS